jgi:hypothetical protein
MSGRGGGILYSLVMMVLRCFIRRDAYRFANTRERLARAERKEHDHE